MISLLLLNLPVLLFTVTIVSLYFNSLKLIDTILCIAVFYFSFIIISEESLGLFGFITVNNLLIINLLVLSFLPLLIRKQKMRPEFMIQFKNAISNFTYNKFIFFCISIILGFSLVKLILNLYNPPFGWDDLNYHFTFPVEWLKHGNLNNPIVISDDPAPTYYPINGNLLFLWLMLPLKNVFMADLGQIPFFILGFLAIYSLGRKLNLNQELSFLAACLFTLIPNYFKQMEVAYIDVMVAALFLVNLNCLFLMNKEFSLQNVIMYSMSLGLLLGTKTIALPYSALLFLPFIYLSVKNINKFQFVIASSIIILLLGGFSYIRNFIDTGNPLYPLDFKLFGKTIFRGVIDDFTYRVHFKIEDYRLSKLLFHEGLGAQSLIFILPSLFLALPVTLIKRIKSLNFNLAYFLILPFLVYLIYRYIIPFANARYLYPLLGVGIISGFYMADVLNIPKHILKILGVICILASMFELANHIELIASIILTCLLFFILPLSIQIIQRQRLISKMSVSALIVFLITMLIFFEKDYVINEYPRYIRMIKYSGFWPDATKAWNWLNKNTTGNNIAYVGRPVPFPLYGSNFKNCVYYVSVNKIEPAKLHYFPNSRYRWDYGFLSLHKNLEEKVNYRGDADYSVWFNNLLRRNTDYLFVYSLHQVKDVEFPLEDNWAKSNPDKFTPVFTNGTIHIYRILR